MDTARELRRQGDSAEARLLRFKDEMLGELFFERVKKSQLTRYPDHPFIAAVNALREDLRTLAENPEDEAAGEHAKEEVLKVKASLEEAEKTGPLESWGRCLKF